MFVSLTLLSTFLHISNKWAGVAGGVWREGRRGSQKPREQAAAASRRQPPLAPAPRPPAPARAYRGRPVRTERASSLLLAHTSPRIKARNLGSGLRAAPAHFSPAAAGAERSKAGLSTLHSPRKGMLPTLKSTESHQIGRQSGALATKTVCQLPAAPFPGLQTVHQVQLNQGFPVYQPPESLSDLVTNPN